MFFRRGVCKHGCDVLFCVSLLILLQVYNSDSDSTSVFSGKSHSTHLVLFIILGAFLGLVFLGILAEVFYLKLRKAKKKVDSGEGKYKITKWCNLEIRTS